MSIVLNIHPELEKRLLLNAKKKGMDVQHYIVELLQRQVTPHIHTSSEPLTENELLQKINLGFTPEFWQHYSLLIEKRQSETLTLAEQQELITFSDQIELANAQRIQNLVLLAKIRQTTLPEVMKNLGIQNHKS